jgi:hypothetical protein
MEKDLRGAQFTSPLDDAAQRDGFSTGDIGQAAQWPPRDLTGLPPPTRNDYELAKLRTP